MSERRILFLLGMVQLINVIDFMMVMPLGPDFAAHLGIPTAQLGLVAGSYTAAAALAGIIGAQFLDRFDRRRALFFSLLGLVLGTAAGGLAQGYTTMLIARVVAGAFGGPASSLCMAIIADVVPPERRGRAIGAVAGAFAVASVLGVPAGLKLSEWGGWRTPFLVVAALGLVVAIFAIAMMPPLRKHLDNPHAHAPSRPMRAFLADPMVFLPLFAMAVMMAGTFALISNLPAYLQFNLGYPRAHLDHLYMAGGLISFVGMRLAGRLIDRRGAVLVATLGTVVMMGDVALFFLPARPPVPVLLLFPMWMLANATRAVALNALTSRVPPPHERARFMSTQSVAQHLATAAGAIASTAVLTEHTNHALDGMVPLAVVTLLLSATLPFLLARLATLIKRRDQAAAAG